MKWCKSPIFLLLPLFLFSCGLEEFYFLPQVNPGTKDIYSATIEIPSLSQSYAMNFTIFYRIYISGQLLSSIEESQYGSINSQLLFDYNNIEPYTDPTNTTASTSIDTMFKGSRYFELNLEDNDIDKVLTTSGGTLSIRFPNMAGDIPFLTMNNGDIISLKRNIEIQHPQSTSNDLTYFRYSVELNNNSNETNADVHTGAEGYAYVSMYIVAVGYNIETFRQIYSKPTHIGIFMLPALY